MNSDPSELRWLLQVLWRCITFAGYDGIRQIRTAFRKITIEEQQIKKFTKWANLTLIAFGCPHSSVRNLKNWRNSLMEKGEKGSMDLHIARLKNRNPELIKRIEKSGAKFFVIPACGVPASESSNA